MKVSNSGIQKIERAIACGFVPGNGWHGPAQFIRARKLNKQRKAKK